MDHFRRPNILINGSNLSQITRGPVVLRFRGPRPLEIEIQLRPPRLSGDYRHHFRTVS